MKDFFLYDAIESLRGAASLIYDRGGDARDIEPLTERMRGLIEGATVGLLVNAVEMFEARVTGLHAQMANIDNRIKNLKFHSGMLKAELIARMRAGNHTILQRDGHTITLTGDDIVIR